MALDLVRVREALTDQIRARVDRGLNCYAFFVDAPSLPAVVLLPGEPFVEAQMSNGPGPFVTVRFDVRILVPAGDSVSAQKALDELLSAGTGEADSVLDAIEADRTLGGVVSTLLVTQIVDRGRIQLGDGGTQAQTASLLVELVVRRD